MFLFPVLLVIFACPTVIVADMTPAEKVLYFTLPHAVSQALNCNRTLLSTMDQLTEARYGIDLAESEFTLSINPNGQAGYGGGDREKGRGVIGGGVDFNKKWTTGTTLLVAPSIIKRGNHYYSDVSATLTQPLLRGLGKDYQLSNLHGAQFAMRSARRALYMAQSQLAMRTIQSLYNVKKQELSLQLNLVSEKRMNHFYKSVQLKGKMGLSDPLDLYRAELELRLATDMLNGTKERLEEAKDLLRDLLALSLEAEIEVDVPTYYAPHEVDEEKAIEIALLNRIEMEQAQDDHFENARLVRLAKKNLVPELNVVFNYANVGRTKRIVRDWNRGRENIWGVGLTTSTDFTPLADQIAYEQSTLAMTSSLREIDQTRATLILEVKKVVRQLVRARDRIQLEEEQKRTAEGELRLATLKYNRGMADNFNVIQAEKSLRLAEQNYQDALIDHIIGEYQLLYVVGLLIDKPLILRRV